MAQNPAKLERNLTIAQDYLKPGASYAKLAKSYGLTKAAIHYILTDDEIKDVIATGTREMVSLIPKALDNYKGFLESDDAKIKLTASQDVLKNTSITPSHNTNQMIVNINTGSRPELSPEVIQLLKIHNQQDNDIIDIDLGLEDGR